MLNLQCELGILSKSDGSATFYQGDTKVTCGVFGPAEVRIHRELIDKACLDCIFKPKVGLAGVKEKLLEEIVRATCEEVILVKLYPRSAIQIVMQLIQDSGSMLSCLINSACMALILTGVPMKCRVASVSCAIHTNGEVLINPSNEDEAHARCLLTLSFESKNLQVISSHTTGSFTVDEYFNCLDLARKSVAEVFSFQRSTIKRFLCKELPMEDLSADELE